MKLGTAIDQYIASDKCSRTAAIHLTTVKKHYAATIFGHMNAEFSSNYITTMLKTDSQYGRPFQKATISRQFDAIRALLTYHAELKGVEPPLSPFKKKMLGKGWEKYRERLLETHEYEPIKNAMKTRLNKIHWPLLMDLALETGARQGELILADAKEFNLQTRGWNIPAEHTKAKKARYVPLSVKATKIVTELIRLLEVKIHQMSQSESTGKMPTRVFFPFTSVSAISTNFKKIIDSLRIEDFHFHDLRHTAITNMVLYKKNLKIEAIMKIVGHTSKAMTDRYTHLRGNPDLVAAME